MIALTIPTPTCPITGSDFANSVRNVDRLEREIIAREALLAGNVPDHMRSFVDVRVSFVDGSGTPRVLIVSVLPDYLTIGTSNDSLLVPLNPLTAQAIADAWHCVITTPLLVRLTWQQATKLPPQPWGPPYDASMMGIERIVAHNSRVQDKEKQLGVKAGELLSGHKKDVVLSTRLALKPKNVAIFGWIQPNGSPIQPLSTVHENTYADYSHGVRLVYRSCLLDDVPVDISSVLQDPVLCMSISDEGPLSFLRQPNT